MNVFKPLAFVLLLPLGAIVNAAPEKVINSNVINHSIIDTLAWDAKLPFDQDTKVGKLANGFTYYIRKNVEPEKRVTMYLAVKVGSILENEHQLGLAHFLEHMNFNGLKHFPKNELVDYLQRAGVRFGSDLNAYTSFDETVYQLPIPSDDPELLKNGLQVMRDWAQDAMLEDDEINKERGIVMEEMRGGRGAMQRMRDQYLKVMLNGSRYADRLPIGTEKIIMNFDPETIREFHQEWYRPELQSIIIVGDIDPVQIENEVKRLFSDMRTETNPQERKEYKIDLLDKNQFIKVTDPEMTYTVGQILIKHPEEKVVTVKDYRRSLLKSVYSQILNARLGELGQSANSPFIQSGVDISKFLGGLDNLTAFFVSKPGEFELGFKSIIREMDRVKEFGFTDSEFTRAVNSISKGNEISYIERDKRKSESYVGSYLSHFLNDNPAISSVDRYQITKQLLPTLTRAEVEQIGQDYYIENNRDVLVLAPEADKDKLPDQGMIDTWFKEVGKEELTAYVDQVSELPMLPEQPQKGTITSEKSIEEIAAKELILSNGVRVILKPTTFKNDEILINAFSPGGTSLYTDEDYMSANFAGNLVNSSGIGQLNTIELQKYLTGKNVNISPYINERSEGLYGSSDKEGLQVAFEMIYGYFTQARIEDDIFQSIISKQVNLLQNQGNDPNFVYSRDILSTLYGNNIRRIPHDKAMIESVDQNKALEIYNDRFSDAADFTFVIVGSFTEEEIKPYLEGYLASLPTKGREEQAKDLKIIEPAKGVEKITYKGQESKANVRMTIYGDYTFNAAENMNASALQTILSTRLIERLREDESGVYGTGARFNYSKFPNPRYSFTVAFGTAVDKYESLINSTLDELKKIKENGPSKLDLDKFIIEQKRQLELNLKENGFWSGQLISAYQNETDPALLTQYLENLDKVSIESVKEFANKYLKEDQMFKFILLPDEVQK